MGHSMHPNLGNDLTKVVIGAAIAVHKTWGPGLDEADYERALHVELLALGIDHACQVALPVVYKGVQLDCGYRLDLVVAGTLLIELKAAENLHPLHEAQLLTYLKLSNMGLGLLINFNVLLLREGVVRRANSMPAPTEPLNAVAAPAPHAFDPLSEEVMAAALEVQHWLGPGLLRSAYEVCLAHELTLRGLKVERGLPVNLLYREELIPSNKVIPLIVEGRLIASCHCVSQLSRLQLARDRSLLKAAGVETGLTINFSSNTLAVEIRRIRRAA